jgi:hypothetical protein
MTEERQDVTYGEKQDLKKASSVYVFKECILLCIVTIY